MPCAPALDRSEVFEQEQIKVNETIEELEHPVAGRIRQPRPAARFDKTPAAIGAHAPTLGQHTEEILEELGVDAAAMARKGVVVA